MRLLNICTLNSTAKYDILRHFQHGFPKLDLDALNAEAMIGRPVAASSSTLGRPRCRAQRQAMSCDALI